MMSYKLGRHMTDQLKVLFQNSYKFIKIKFVHCCTFSEYFEHCTHKCWLTLGIFKIDSNTACSLLKTRIRQVTLVILLFRFTVRVLSKLESLLILEINVKKSGSSFSAFIVTRLVLCFKKQSRNRRESSCMLRSIFVIAQRRFVVK